MHLDQCFFSDWFTFADPELLKFEFHCLRRLGAIFKNKSGLSRAINEKKVNSNFSSVGLSNVKLVDSCSSKLATLFGTVPENYRSEIGEISDLTRGRHCPAMILRRYWERCRNLRRLVVTQSPAWTTRVGW